jgi:hypothetical protein
MKRTLLHDDVVFATPAADSTAYAKYGATVVAAGGAHASDYVNKLKRSGMHVAGSISCLSAHSHDLHANADLAAAVARDIAGEPIAAIQPAKGTIAAAPRYFGCVNHPAFRAYVRRKVCDAIAGGADGLHIDDHLSSAASLSRGGCFCEYCMSGFAGYLSKQSDPTLASTADVASFEGFDYRAFVNAHVSSPEQYLSTAASFPLHNEFVDFQLSSAADNVVALGKLAEDVAGRSLSLSANATLPALDHAVVLPRLTYCASEIDHNAPDAGLGLQTAISAYRMAEAIGIPVAATATPRDWAFVNSRRADSLVTLWIALAYACGQRFMAPNRMPCAAADAAAHWYCGPAATFSPLYAFVRTHGFLLNDFAAVGPLARPDGIPLTLETSAKRDALFSALAIPPAAPLTAGNSAWVFPRVKGDGAVAIHVVNHAYNVNSQRVERFSNVEVRLPNRIFNRIFTNATVYSYGAEPAKLTVQTEGDSSVFVLPELNLWSIVTFEYWA